MMVRPRPETMKYDNLRTVEQVLESDDEYPDNDSLADDAMERVYLNDGRFDYDGSDDITNIDFELNRYLIRQSKERFSQSITKLKQLENYLNKKAFIFGSSFHLERCILTKQDFLCLMEIEPTVSDAVFIWFLNYLKQRDMQKQCEKHLVSCLVTEHGVELYKIEEATPFKKNYSFSFVDLWKVTPKI